MNRKHTGRRIPQVLQAARAMRKGPTPAERVLWNELRDNRLCDASIRRQHPIDRYIVDFVCIGAKLVVEADGPGHCTPEQADYDRGRADLLLEMGYCVLRFPNERILNDLAGVLAETGAALAQ